MAQQDYSQELHDLMYNVVQYNQGVIDQKTLTTKVKTLKTRRAGRDHIPLHQPWMRALDYLKNQKTKITIMQDLCKFEHKIKIVIECLWTEKCEHGVEPLPTVRPTFILEVYSSDSVHVVKQKIHKVKKEIPPSELKLFNEQKQLEDDQTLSDCNIQNGATLQAERRLYVIFHFLDDSTLTMDIELDYTFEELQAKMIQLKEESSIKTPREHYIYGDNRLIWSGKQIGDRLTVGDYNIQPGDKIHVIPRLRGS